MVWYVFGYRKYRRKVKDDWSLEFVYQKNNGYQGEGLNFLGRYYLKFN